MLVTGLPVAGLTITEPPCVYVMGQEDEDTVATPALVVFVPPEEAETQPVRVHLDDRGQRILGYSEREPGEDEPTDGGRVFFRGLPWRGARPVPEQDGRVRWCQGPGGSTPAVPIHVSTSILDVPGVLQEVPAIRVTLQGTSVTMPGHLLTLKGVSLVIPLTGAATEVSPRAPSESSIALGLPDAPDSVRYLPPPAPGTPEEK